MHPSWREGRVYKATYTRLSLGLGNSLHEMLPFHSLKCADHVRVIYSYSTVGGCRCY